MILCNKDHTLNNIDNISPRTSWYSFNYYRLWIIYNRSALSIFNEFNSISIHLHKCWPSVTRFSHKGHFKNRLFDLLIDLGNPVHLRRFKKNELGSEGQKMMSLMIVWSNNYRYNKIKLGWLINNSVLFLFLTHFWPIFAPCECPRA